MPDTKTINDILTFIKVKDDSNTLQLANRLLKGDALCIDFNDCDLKKASDMINFLSGVNYATDGYVKRIQKNIFVFAMKEQYKEPKLKDFFKKYSK